MEEDQDVALIKIVTKRLVIALLVLMLASFSVLLGFQLAGESLPLWPLCTAFGVTGGFISVQRRLKNLGQKDLAILSSSWWTVILAPIVGGILAVVLLVLFMSGILNGPLFPVFEAISTNAKDFSRLLECTAKSHEDYAKIIFWSFVAGFCENFVTKIIGNFSDRDPPIK